MDFASFIIGYTAGLATLVIFWIAGFILRPWSRALFSGAPVPILTILGMRLRRTPAVLVIDAYIQLVKRNKKPSITQVETLFITYRSRIHTAEDLVDIVMHEEP
jgi:uncharacterized protein YqfA (UPF0365 family)